MVSRKHGKQNVGRQQNNEYAMPSIHHDGLSQCWAGHVQTSAKSLIQAAGCYAML